MSRFAALALVTAAGTSGGPASVDAAAGTPLAVIVHPGTRVDSLSAGELESIFRSQRRHWRGGASIVAFNYPANHPLRVAFDRAVLRMSPDEVSKFWIDQRIRGRAGSPRKVPQPELMVRVVARLEGAIGYAPISEARRANVKIVAIVRGRQVKDP